MITSVLAMQSGESLLHGSRPESAWMLVFFLLLTFFLRAIRRAGPRAAVHRGLSTVLHCTQFRNGFLGLLLLCRGSISHNGASSSESRARACIVTAVVAMLTVLAVEMGWARRPFSRRSSFIDHGGHGERSCGACPPFARVFSNPKGWTAVESGCSMARVSELWETAPTAAIATNQSGCASVCDCLATILKATKGVVVGGRRFERW